MNLFPSISIIVPIYNLEHYLSKCIDSILVQTFINFELILVNDGSTDNCGNICDEYAQKDSRIVVIHKKNGGVSSARNAGLDFAQGEYIGWVDADDYIATDMYETLYHLAIDYNADISECNYAQVNSDKQTPCKYGIGIEYGSGDFMIEKFLSGDIYYGLWTKLFNRKLFDNIRFPISRIFEDTWMTLNFCLEQHKYVRTNDVKYYYEQTHNSIIRSNISPRKAREYIFILENQLALINVKAKNNELTKRLRTRIMEKSVLWYLGLALSDDEIMRNIYSRLYLKRMKYCIGSCFFSNKIQIKNKISYILCKYQLGGLIRSIKQSLRKYL